MTVQASRVGHIDLGPLEEPKLVVDSLPPTYLLHNGSIVGHYSYKATGIDSEDSVDVLNTEYPAEFPIRILSRRHMRALPHSRIFDTETAFTRCYLKSLPPVIARKKEVEGRNKTRPPQYCQPTESNVECFYVDISAAYLNIYQRMSWRVRYLRGKYFSNDDDKLIYPFPHEWKSGRSYVITGALPASVHYIQDHKVVVRPSFNRFENPCLVAAVWDVLGAIGRYAVDVYGARYYNLDGAVIAESKLGGYCDFLDALGLPYRIKYRGRSHILNLAVWQIGDKVTRRYGTMNLPVKTDALPVTMAEAEWILTRFVRMRSIAE